MNSFKIHTQKMHFLSEVSPENHETHMNGFRNSKLGEQKRVSLQLQTILLCFFIRLCETVHYPGK